MLAGTRIHHKRTNCNRSSYRQEHPDSSRTLQSSTNLIFKSPRIGLIHRLCLNSALDSGENVAAIIIVRDLATLSSLSLLSCQSHFLVFVCKPHFPSRVILCSDHLLRIYYCDPAICHILVYQVCFYRKCYV